MKLTPRPHPWFWYIYKIINFHHSFNYVKRDKNLWIETHIKIRWYKKKLKHNHVKQICIGFAWLFPALVIIWLTIVYSMFAPWNYVFAIVWVIFYHLASMYYIIEISDILKIECFSIGEKKKTYKKNK